MRSFRPPEALPSFNLLRYSSSCLPLCSVLSFARRVRWCSPLVICLIVARERRARGHCPPAAVAHRHRPSSRRRCRGQLELLRRRLSLRMVLGECAHRLPLFSPRIYPDSVVVVGFCRRHAMAGGEVLVLMLAYAITWVVKLHGGCTLLVRASGVRKELVFDGFASSHFLPPRFSPPARFWPPFLAGTWSVMFSAACASRRWS